MRHHLHALEQKLEDYVVGGLIDFDDVAYDAHVDLLYDMAGQVVRHLTDYLSAEDARKVLRLYQREIARFIHVQMQKHFWQDTSGGIEVVIKRGFTAILPSAYTTSASEPILDFKSPPPDRNNIARYLFGGFKRCLFAEQKFQSDTERKMAVILDRESEKWFKPAKRQFQLFYRSGIDHLEYQPDFVVEMSDRVLMLERKHPTRWPIRWCWRNGTSPLNGARGHLNTH